MERSNSFAADQIVMSKRQASMMMASMLLFCLFVFIVGFFLGKRSAIDDFSDKMGKQVLHDQIDFLLTTQSLQSSQQDEPTDSQTASEFSSASFDQPFDNPIINLQSQDNHTQGDHLVKVDPIIALSADEIVHDNVHQIEKDVVSKSKLQYAQLIGFGTKKAAQGFVARLKKHNVPVILKTMMSKTASGKERVWYQAITPTYESLQELQGQVAKVKRLEHIRDTDIKIIYTK